MFHMQRQRKLPEEHARYFTDTLTVGFLHCSCLVLYKMLSKLYAIKEYEQQRKNERLTLKLRMYCPGKKC